MKERLAHQLSDVIYRFADEMNIDTTDLAQALLILGVKNLASEPNAWENWKAFSKAAPGLMRDSGWVVNAPT